MNINVNISDKQIREVINKLTSIKNKISDEVNIEIAAAAEEIVTLAKQKAPEFIAPQIYSKKIDYLNYAVRSDFIYSAYFEFGTGRFFRDYRSQLTPEWIIIANQFYVNGLGRLDKIPYLYPSFNEVRPKLFKRIIDLFKEIK
jgi:hypothetical protein